jgi:hypothetical protein
MHNIKNQYVKMGRFYHGTIGGKFWFGIQSSNDASNFKESLYEPVEYYTYYGCGCEVEDNNKLYCDNCYSDYETQFNELDECDVSTLSGYPIREKYMLAYHSNYIRYTFDKEELNHIKNKLNEIELEIGGDIINKLRYTIDIENQYEYDLDELKPQDTIKLELLARWCLGKQIESALINEDSCEFDCEL